MKTNFLLALALLCLASSVEAQEKEAEPSEEAWEEEWVEEAGSGLEIHGFVEAALGTRLDQDEAHGLDDTLQELRIRAELSRAFGSMDFSLKADLLGDGLSEDTLDLSVREAQLSFSAGDADFRIGRQVLTWGTGDLVFLNDLFPKDWVSFFAGRETSYLKYPSDSVKVSVYKPLINIDLAWTPVFESDRFLTGERFSYFSPARGEIVAAPPRIDPVEPDRTLDNGELAIRLHRNLGSKEIAFYAYRGFFKQPVGFDPALRSPVFPPLSAWGASLRGPSLGGISNVEVAWYDSRDDRSGSDPLVPNSQARALLGHERELASRLNLGLQYYAEVVIDHGRMIASLPAERRSVAAEQVRHVITTRLTYRMRQDSVSLSFFAFYSPSEDDWFAIPSVGYRVSDRWQWDAGLNLFGGSRDHTFFGQFEDNSSAYSRLRFSF